NQTPDIEGLAKFFLYSRKITASLATISEGFYLVFRHGLYKNPNNPANTRYVQHFCRQLCKVFNIEVQVHGEIPREPALWVSNHVSWLDIAVLGSGARVFFRAKAEIENWPILGKLAKVGVLYLLNVVQEIQSGSVNKLPVFSNRIFRCCSFLKRRLLMGEPSKKCMAGF